MRSRCCRFKLEKPIHMALRSLYPFTYRFNEPVSGWRDRLTSLGTLMLDQVWVEGQAKEADLFQQIDGRRWSLKGVENNLSFSDADVRDCGRGAWSWVGAPFRGDTPPHRPTMDPAQKNQSTSGGKGHLVQHHREDRAPTPPLVW